MAPRINDVAAELPSESLYEDEGPEVTLDEPETTETEEEEQPGEQGEHGLEEPDVPDHWTQEMRDEVAQTIKGFKAQYTKKTQELADLKRKANAFDTLTSDPERLRAFLGGNGNGNGNQPEPEPDPYQDVNPEELLEGDALTAIRALIARETKSQLAEGLKPFEGHAAYVQSMAKRDISKKWDAIKERYPFASEYEQQLQEFAKTYGVSDINQAFMAVAGDKVLEHERQIALRDDVKKRRKAQLPQRGAARRSVKPTPKRHKDMLDHFLDAQKESGIGL